MSLQIAYVDLHSVADENQGHEGDTSVCGCLRASIRSGPKWPLASPPDFPVGLVNKNHLSPTQYTVQHELENRESALLKHPTC